MDSPRPTSDDAKYVLMMRDFAQAERPRERLMQVGAKAVSTAELLAIIMRTGVGGENVVRLAERLLTTFRDLPGIAKATVNELTRVKGIGPAKAVEIKAALEVGRRLMIATPEDKVRITSPDDAANLIMSEMALLEQEHLRVLILDTRNQVSKVSTVYIGNLNTSLIRVGEVFKTAIRENGAALIVAHNHPSGDPSPSPEDVQVTRKMVEAGKLLNIEVLDHLIIGRNQFVSMKERGLGF